MFVWLIWLPLLFAPLVYLAGRLLSAQVARWTTLAGLLAMWWPFVLVWQRLESQIFTLGQVTLRLDGVSLLVTAVVLTLATLITLYSDATLDGMSGTEKYYAMLLAMSGSMIGLSCATDLFNLWLWFEATAVTSYLLVAFYRDQAASLEAGVKYLVQSMTGSVLVLFGVALVLAQTGTLALSAIREQATTSPLLLAASALFVIGFGVKIAIVPLHTWLPDAHAQAPSGISALLSGIVIEIGFIALLRTIATLIGATSSWGILLLGLGALNMLVGNLLALPQTQVKRLLAFSSISHIGYMLTGVGIAVYSGEMLGVQAGFFHLLTHGLMKGLAFLAAGALLYGLHTAVHDHTPLTIDELSGTAWRYPLVAVSFTLALFSLGGIPPLAGFMSKWQILLAGMATGQAVIIAFVAFAALNSLLSLAYYVPLVQVIFRRDVSLAVPGGRPTRTFAPLPFSMNLPIFLLTVAIVVIGLWPSLILGLTQGAGQALFSVISGQ
jgi:proton-translocating NADH-quinone oxidoreductase chain N